MYNITANAGHHIQGSHFDSGSAVAKVSCNLPELEDFEPALLQGMECTCRAQGCARTSH